MGKTDTVKPLIRIIRLMRFMSNAQKKLERGIPVSVIIAAVYGVDENYASRLEIQAARKQFMRDRHIIEKAIGKEAFTQIRGYRSESLFMFNDKLMFK